MRDMGVDERDMGVDERDMGVDERDTGVDEWDTGVDEEIHMKIYNYMLILVLNKKQYYSVEQESMYLISLYCGISINNNYSDMS